MPRRLQAVELPPIGGLDRKYPSTNYIETELVLDELAGLTALEFVRWTLLPVSRRDREKWSL
jgi:hypothetical protein